MRDLGLGGDFFIVVGGEGGGGAAFRAGIVIGDGTFCGEKAGEIGEPSFSISLLILDTRLSGLSRPFRRLELSPFDFPFFVEPFCFPRFAGFLVVMIFPLTTDTVTSSSPPGVVLSSESLSNSGKGFGDGLGDTLGLENKGSLLGVGDFWRCSSMDETQDCVLSPSGTTSGFGGNILNFLKEKYSLRCNLQ